MNKIPFNAETQRARRSAEMSRFICFFRAAGNFFPLREPLRSLRLCVSAANLSPQCP
jgi:hypothetical protein